MARFNVRGLREALSSPLRTNNSSRNHENGHAYGFDAKTALFVLAVSGFAGEDAFYESAETRDHRFVELVRETTTDDPEWTVRFLRWLRSEANLRTAALVGAAEFVHTRLENGAHGLSRSVISSVLQRADEPGELLGYWFSTHGRAVPKPLKRGVADAVTRLYTERAYLKWDSDSRAIRFADVVELVHPKPKARWQAALFEHILDARHDRGDDVPASLGTLRARRRLTALPAEERRVEPVALAEAGMTWESVAGWLQGPMTAAVWEALLPSMGYMAKLRNLRNFDEAGLSDEVAARVAAELSDPEAVRASRQLPLRFLSAYRAVAHDRWQAPLDQALQHSLRGVPRLAGRTLILVDTSSSMTAPFSRDGMLQRWDAATLFGLALAKACAGADVVSYSHLSKEFRLRRGENLLRAAERWRSSGYFLGGGTRTATMVERHFRRHDRVVVLTDEQTADGVVRAPVPLYTWNLAGYRFGHAPSGTGRSHTFAGLNDASFGMIALLEAGRNADWPF
ncbi:hypothetical protein FHX82_002316 [Amycolatopsis bartoniae]|uniref:RNA-binding protein n=1 Tax=Amycolatopsis bartoniae TaxID=941986 RepID=A0A8H9M5C1_9PSEU|nr:TROVE domain-containing protein [Amycolatopsis bartoniae]MBB2935296.1 hypothetical protein [Amycolatopsis bartoniae]TVT06801.1 TROVE domain-containing protein [Amycolatopsis bartoniae]GHF55828.1 RNA-binding protein [Amycolatopsis bartoniae]